MTETQLTYANGIRISLPDTLEAESTYVLQEQLDWHEEDIRFLRRVLQPGQQALDFGAGDGVYTLSMARSVGPSGHVLAFETAPDRSLRLSVSIAANQFGQVSLETSTLADTLDDYLDRSGWQTMDLVRFGDGVWPDDILAGGTRFFGTLSPLVLASPQPSLIPALATLGYDAYRLAPGLDMLVPFRADEMPDEPFPSMYACKPELAEQLSARGLLVPADALDAARLRRDELVAMARKRAAYQWGHALCKLPFGDAFSDIWYDCSPAKDTPAVMDSLALHALSRDSSQSSPDRVAALEAACDILGKICDERPDYLRQSTLARMASELGLRHRAVQALKALLDRMLRVKQIDLSEPFLPPEPRFEGVKPGNAPGQWALAMTLEAYERWVQPSSFHTRDTARERLVLIRELGFGNAEMERRLNLVERRYGPASDTD